MSAFSNQLFKCWAECWNNCWKSKLTIIRAEKPKFLNICFLFIGLRKCLNDQMVAGCLSGTLWWNGGSWCWRWRWCSHSAWQCSNRNDCAESGDFENSGSLLKCALIRIKCIPFAVWQSQCHHSNRENCNKVLFN